MSNLKFRLKRSFATAFALEGFSVLIANCRPHLKWVRNEETWGNAFLYLEDYRPMRFSLGKGFFIGALHIPRWHFAPAATIDFAKQWNNVVSSKSKKSKKRRTKRSDCTITGNRIRYERYTGLGFIAGYGFGLTRLSSRFTSVKSC